MHLAVHRLRSHAPGFFDLLGRQTQNLALVILVVLCISSSTVTGKLENYLLRLGIHSITGDQVTPTD